jgi:hypothetical protein
MNEAIISGASVTALVNRFSKSGGSLSAACRQKRGFRRASGRVFEHLFADLRALRHPARSLASIIYVPKRGPGHEGPKLAREAASGAAGARAFLLQMR